jgi:hypothetical protein
MRVRHLKVLYVLFGLLWAGYYSEGLLSYHVTHHVPMSSGTLFCLLLFISVPTLGYGLLFKLFPLAGRFLRRSN